MIISKELFVGKKLADGSHPVAIRICHKGRMKRIFTSVSCKKRNWNHSKLCVLRKDPDFRLKNETVETVFRRVSSGVQDHIDRCLDRDFESLAANIGKDPDFRLSRSSECMSLALLADRKAEASSRLNTRRGYESFARYIRSKFGEGPDIGEIDQTFINLYIKTIEEDYADRSGMRPLMVNKLKAVLSHGASSGWPNPAEKLVFPKYVAVRRDRNISLQELAVISGIMRSRLGSDPSFSSESTVALAIFILDIAFQGIAPVDLAALRIKDLRFMILQQPEDGGTIEAVAIDTSRKKTGHPVRIVVYLPPIREILGFLMTGRADDDFLIPCFDRKKTYSDKQCQDRLANYFHKLAELLNLEIGRECYDSGAENFRRVTYYCARHAFCNLADSLDIPHHLIRKMVGHKETVLERSYLRPLSDLEQALISKSILGLLGLGDSLKTVWPKDPKE